MEWISVQLTVPRNKMLLISTISENGTRLTPHIAALVNTGLGLQWVTDYGDEPVGLVTHYQPLPEPPEE